MAKKPEPLYVTDIEFVEIRILVHFSAHIPQFEAIYTPRPGRKYGISRLLVCLHFPGGFKGCPWNDMLVEKTSDTVFEHRRPERTANRTVTMFSTAKLFRCAFNPTR